MASLTLMFEKLVGTTDDLLFSFDATHLWDLTIIAPDGSDAAVTIYTPPTGSLLGTHTEWIIAPTYSIVAGGMVVVDKIVTPAGRSVRAYASVPDVIVRGCGVRQ